MALFEIRTKDGDIKDVLANTAEEAMRRYHEKYGEDKRIALCVLLTE